MNKINKVNLLKPLGLNLKNTKTNSTSNEITGEYFYPWQVEPVIIDSPITKEEKPVNVNPDAFVTDWAPWWNPIDPKTNPSINAPTVIVQEPGSENYYG